MSRFFVLFTAFFMSGSLFAQTSTSSATSLSAVTPVPAANTSSNSLSDLQKPDEKSKDPNEEITNARMRAEAGSKSRFSLKGNISYSGGSVEKPMDRLRPNYRSGVATDTETSMGGTLALAFRPFRDKITLRGGTGIAIRTPFHNKDKELGQNHRDQSDTRVIDVSTPYVELATTFRTGNLMLQPALSLNYFTKQIHRETFKKDWEPDASIAAVYEIEGSKWQPGASLTAYNTFYQDGKQDFDVIGNGNARDDYGAGIYPFLEYAFSDRYSFRTLVGISFTHVRSAPVTTFIKDKVYQSMGIGIAYTKEVYFYPNVQFLPDNIRGDLTNVGLSTTMSVF